TGCPPELRINVFGLCVRAGFGAQNCQLALHLSRSKKLQVCTSPRLTQNPCYRAFFFSLSIPVYYSCHFILSYFLSRVSTNVQIFNVFILFCSRKYYYNLIVCEVNRIIVSIKSEFICCLFYLG